MEQIVNREQRAVQSVEVGGRLLIALGQHAAPMSLKDLAAAADLPASRAHPYLVSFGRLGLIEQDGTSGRYALGPAALDRIGAHPGHSARLNLQTIARAAEIAPERVDQVLDAVELTADAHRPIGTYSTGMTQRCALAAALLGDPTILLLDEPANGLDPGGIRWLRTFLRKQADAGVAVLVSSHQLAELGAMVDHVVVLHKGRLVMNGPTRELFRITGTDDLEDAFLALTDSAERSLA